MNGRVDGWKDRMGWDGLGWQHCERSIYIGAHIGGGIYIVFLSLVDFFV